MASEGTIEFVIKLRGGSQAAEDARKVEHAVAGVGGKMRHVASESERANKRISGFGGGLKRMALGLGAAAAGYAAWSAAKNAINYTTNLAKTTNVLAKNTTLSTAEASRFAAVTDVMGISSGKLGMLIRNLNKQQLAQAENTTHSATAFERLGISQQFAKAHLHDTQGTMALVLDKLHGMGKGAELVSTKAELFGRGWQQVDAILREGSKGFNEWMDTAKKFGVELKSTADISKLIHAQKEYELALDGLKIKFTEIAAGPLTKFLGGMANLIKLGQAGKWKQFDKQINALGQTLAQLAEKVMPRVAQSFAKIAPTVFKAFVRGFLNAPIGTQLFMAGLIATKLGLVGGIFRGVGINMGKALSKGMITKTPEMAAAGSALGTAFEVAFAAAAIAGVAIVAYKAGMALRKALGLGGTFYTDPSGMPIDEKASFKREQQKAAALKAHRPWHENADERRQKAEIDAIIRRRHHHAATGGRMLTSGMVEVGERGPEILNVPGGSQIAPLRAGSLLDERPIILKVDGRVLARVNRRETLQSQAAGA